MNATFASTMSADRNDRVSEVVKEERSRLRNFIRNRVADEGDVEDILQESFYELVKSFQLMRPIEHIGPWLFRVARNRIVDFYRKKKPERSTNELIEGSDGGGLTDLEDLLPSRDAGPEAVYARGVLLDELNAALDELPEEQRAVFIAQEIHGRNFREISAETGIGVNTLISRKRYAVLHLRKRLQTIYDEFTKG
jgi:RNA polymerase sigma factor (sigma-70 family)